MTIYYPNGLKIRQYNPLNKDDEPQYKIKSSKING